MMNWLKRYGALPLGTLLLLFAHFAGTQIVGRLTEHCYAGYSIGFAPVDHSGLCSLASVYRVAVIASTVLGIALVALAIVEWRKQGTRFSSPLVGSFAGYLLGVIAVIGIQTLAPGGEAILAIYMLFLACAFVTGVIFLSAVVWETKRKHGLAVQLLLIAGLVTFYAFARPTILFNVNTIYPYTSPGSE